MSKNILYGDKANCVKKGGDESIGNDPKRDPRLACLFSSGAGGFLLQTFWRSIWEPGGVRSSLLYGCQQVYANVQPCAEQS